MRAATDYVLRFTLLQESMQHTWPLCRFLLVALSVATISACGFIEIKPAYDVNNSGANSEQVRAPAPVKFHNRPQASATTTGNTDIPVDAANSTRVETAALTPSSAPMEVIDLSELPEIIDDNSSVQELTNSAEAPLILPASIELAQIATPVLVADVTRPNSDQDADVNSSEVNGTAEASGESGKPLLNRAITATITPNILVESQIPELAVEQSDIAEVNTTASSTESSSVTNHTVASGETLYSIASRYGVSVEQLAELNSVSPPNYLIFPEMVLQISSAVAIAAAVASDADSYTEHEVKEGETVYSIASLYGMQPEELAQINDIAIPQYLIYPEMLLKVRSIESNISSVDAGTNSATDSVIDWQWPLANINQILDSSIKDLPGVDIIVDSGDTVRAASSGKVILAGENISSLSLMVMIRHDNEYISTYGHMQELTVNKGDGVTAGQVLGRLGNNGKLYFGIGKGSTSLDVRELLGDSQ